MPENSAHVRERLGVTFDAPRYGLIVGNFENASTQQIEEASRRLSSFEILDYDTVLQLYVSSQRSA